jgi:hypothetical protein
LLAFHTQPDRRVLLPTHLQIYRKAAEIAKWRKGKLVIGKILPCFARLRFHFSF